MLPALVALSTLAASLAAQPATLESAWTWNAAARVEWCEPVGGPRPHAALIATRDGKLHLVNLITAKSKLAQPIPVTPDVRFAGDDGRIAYAFTHSKILAISVTPTAEADKPLDTLKWEQLAQPADEQRSGGDPEFVARLIAASATRDGVLVVRSDGRLAELAERDGTLRWSTPLPESAEYRLLVNDRIGVAIHKGSRGIDATYCDLGAGASNAQRRRLGDGLPMWTALTRDGLLGAWPGKLTLATANDDARPVRLKLAMPLVAAAVDAFRPADARERPLFVAIDAGGAISGHDVTTGERAWIVEGVFDGRGRGAQLRVDGTHVLATDGGRTMVAIDATTGSLSGRIAAAEAEKLLGYSATESHLFAVRLLPRDKDDRGGKRRLEVLRSPLFRAGEFSRDRARAQQRSWIVPIATIPRATAWPYGRVLLIDEKRVTALVLPTD